MVGASLTARELLPPFLQLYIREERRPSCLSPIPLILSPSGVTGSNRNSPPSATCPRLSDSPPPAVRQAGLPLQSRRRDRPRPLLVPDLQGPGENRDTLDSSGCGGAHAGTDRRAQALPRLGGGVGRPQRAALPGATGRGGQRVQWRRKKTPSRRPSSPRWRPRSRRC